MMESLTKQIYDAALEVINEVSTVKCSIMVDLSEKERKEGA